MTLESRSEAAPKATIEAPSATAPPELAGARASAHDVLGALGTIPANTNATTEFSAAITTLGLGQVELVGSSSLKVRQPGSARALRVLAVGTHDHNRLAPGLSPSLISPSGVIRGRGVASQFGATLALLQGALAAATSDPSGLDVTTISFGPGDDLAIALDPDPVGFDVVICTEAVAWEPQRPTITAGSKGRLEAKITLRAPASINDRAYAGATLNPLNKLIEILGSLRGERGRINLEDFYQRAHPPDRGELADISDGWGDQIGAPRPAGRLTLTERVTQWPTLSVLSIDSPITGDAAPSSATARVAFGLVPDQRPVDVERSLRAWLDQAVPESLNASIRFVESARPHRSDLGDRWHKHLATALQGVHKATPRAVPAGGMVGSGELHFRHNAPVLQLGIAGPHQRWGSIDEQLPCALFDLGCQVATRLFEAGLGSGPQ